MREHTRHTGHANDHCRTYRRRWAVALPHKVQGHATSVEVLDSSSVPKSHCLPDIVIRQLPILSVWISLKPNLVTPLLFIRPCRSCPNPDWNGGQVKARVFVVTNDPLTIKCPSGYLSELFGTLINVDLLSLHHKRWQIFLAIKDT